MVSPILIIQMQRLGDLILTFPLFLWLKREYPGHPIWVLAEPHFFNPLICLSPAVTYYSFAARSRLIKEKYFLVLNLSHRADAAELAGQVKAEHKLGLLEIKKRGFYIQGKWQLYRSSLVHNNRYNAYHWADLNALDAISLSTISGTSWPEPRLVQNKIKKIGLFLGASELDKRPDHEFWLKLSRILLQKGHRPILLGGQNEFELALKIKKNADFPLLNLCARFELSEIGKIGQTLDVLIAADTGPMHLATWTGLRVINLSMGPVSPWDTGPYYPENYVFRAALSCIDCWKCINADTFCRTKFKPGKIAFLIDGLLKENFKPQPSLAPSGLRILKSGRSDAGLFWLRQQGKIHEPNVHGLFRSFWTHIWAYQFRLSGQESVKSCWRDIAEKYPQLALYFKKSLLEFMLSLRKSFKTGNLNPGFWQETPPFLRPLSGYLELFLQNRDMTVQAFNQAFNFMEELLSIISFNHTNPDALAGTLR